MELAHFFRRITYVTLKVTNGCNLKCSYCNVEADTPRTPRMSLDRFKQVATLLIENATSPYVGLEFHGGEPLLHPDSWFEEAVGFARDLGRRHRKSVDFPLVTNGTMLTEERLLALNRLGIELCMSVDGPPSINDLARGGGQAVERALKLGAKHGIPIGVITVLGKTNFREMRKVMEWFREVPVEGFRINNLQPQGRGHDDALLSGDEMFEGMRQILDHMVETNVSVHEDETALNVRRFLRGRAKKPGLSCWEYQCQAGRTYVAIDHAGTIHACGTDLSNHPIGHLDRPFDEQHYERTLLRLHDKGDWVIRCFGCPAKRICHFSCPTSDFNSDAYKENECRATKLMFRHLEEHPWKAERIDAVITARESRGRRLALSGEGR